MITDPLRPDEDAAPALARGFSHLSMGLGLVGIVPAAMRGPHGCRLHPSYGLRLAVTVPCNVDAGVVR